MRSYTNYAESVSVLDNKLNILFEHVGDSGFYDVYMTADGINGIVGCKNGFFLRYKREKDILLTSRKISAKPIVGVSLSYDGLVHACSSIDQSIYICTEDGMILWSYETEGENWSISLSSDGSFVCFGSGDGNIYLVENYCNSSILDEISLIEKNISTSKHIKTDDLFTNLISLYTRYGLIRYGMEKLQELTLNDPKRLSKFIKKLLLECIDSNNNFEAHKKLADVMKSEGDFINAIHHYQIAAKDPMLHRIALSFAGECFCNIGWDTAVISCYNRSEVQQLDAKRKQVSYNLARLYENKGYFKEAINHYQTVVAYDISYKKAREKLENLLKSSHDNKISYDKEISDYNGLIMAHDISSNDVDEKILSIIEDSSKEFELRLEECQKFEIAINFINEISGTTTNTSNKILNYDTSLYLKYDHLLPEDEVKKKLEMANLLTILEDNKQIKLALDIGAATGRYPMMFKKRGIKTIGVDREFDAMMYAQNKKIDNEFPHFSVCDAIELPFNHETFDLITCMMGTFAHFNDEDRAFICKEIIRVLKPGGLLIISTWDIECNYLTYLSMYSNYQKEIIRTNSLTQNAINSLLKEFGMEILYLKPFAFLTDLSSYELKIDEINQNDLRRIIEFDLGIRDICQQRHGQMYMVCAQKISFS